MKSWPKTVTDSLELLKLLDVMAVKIVQAVDAKDYQNPHDERIQKLD